MPALGTLTVTAQVGSRVPDLYETAGTRNSGCQPLTALAGWLAGNVTNCGR